MYALPALTMTAAEVVRDQFATAKRPLPPASRVGAHERGPPWPPCSNGRPARLRRAIPSPPRLALWRG